MTTGSRESSRSTCRPRVLRASLPSRRKKRRKKRGGDIMPMRLLGRLRRRPRPGRLRSARCLQAAPACIAHHVARRSACGSRNTNHGLYTSSTPSQRNEVMAVVSRASAVRWGEMQAGLPCPRRVRAVENSRTGCAALRVDDLRPRRREGASFSQIRCLLGRSVGRECERDAQPETAAQSLLPCLLLPGIARHFPAPFYCLPAHDCAALRGKKILPLSKCPRTASRSPWASRRAPLAAAADASGLLGLWRTPNELMLERGTFCLAQTGELSILR